jgi:radical SAM superfamily enzyme YgiQ (UPF0313 family)
MCGLRALLIATYELGRQPFGLASPSAWLRDAGCDVECADLTRDRLADDRIRAADLIAFHLPMHTATRLAGPQIVRARLLNRRARVCAYGLYAPLNAAWLRSLGVNDILGGEYEEDLTAIAREVNGERAALRSCATTEPDSTATDVLPRLHFVRPDRSTLPSLSRYAALRMPDGRSRIVGSTEASRGCRHLCRHCPIVPIYNGQFRIVQPEVVLADIDAQVAAGAEHITFGDPDFLNGPTHAVRIVDALHVRHPHVTYDITTKVEHLLRHRGLLPRLVDSGCVFVTSAVESLDDGVLARLEKGHTRRDFLEAVDLCREVRLTLVPTFVAFHPWLSLDDYCDLLDTIAALELVDRVAPIQLAIRLVVPAGSRMLELEELRGRLGAFDPVTLAYPWTHGDPRVDALHQDVTAIVGSRLTTDRRAVFEEIRALASQRAGRPLPAPLPAASTMGVPYLDEPWYCCAEPNPDHLQIL